MSGRVIVYLYRYVPAGADTVRVLSYIKVFSRLGCKVILVTCKEPGVQIIVPSGVDVVDVFENNNKPHNKIILDFTFCRVINRVGRKGDVIFMYGAPNFGPFVSKKFVRIIEETEVPFHGGSNYSLIQRFANRMRLLGIRLSDGLLTISFALKDYYINKGIKSEKIFVSNMMVDPSRFEGLIKNETAEKYIAYCGSISNHKDGVDTLIRAFAEVHKTIPDLKLKLMGIFSKPEEEEFDKRMVKEMGISGYVDFTGVIPSNELPQILKNAVCLVLARPDNLQAKYGFPTKLGEYLLTENPVVITPVGDIPLYLQDGENAFFAIPGDVNSINKAIVNAVTSPIAFAVGKKGAQVAMRHFNCDEVGKGAWDFMELIAKNKFNK